MDPRLDEFFAAPHPRRDELLALRRILQASPLTETFKWRGPCYAWHDANVAIIGALKDSSILSFFKGALLPDPAGLLGLPGPNSRFARVIRFADAGAIAAAEPAIHALIAAAIAAEDAGQKIAPGAAPDLPPEIAEQLAGDDALAAAFAALTPGRRRGWTLHFTGAKQPQTRLARLEKAAPRILDGKGMNDR